MFEAFFSPVHRFCERTTPFLLGQEVLNDWTHLAFFLGCAIAVWWHSRHGTVRNINGLLAAWIGIIGLASMSLHLYPIGLTYLADTSAITIFMALFTYHAPRQLRGYRPAQALRLSGAFLLATALCGLPSKLIGQEWLTLTFLPSLVFMAWLARTAVTAHARRNFGWATAVFTLSMAAHGADLPTCALTGGYGTHWLWHVCNGLMLTLLVTALPLAKPTKRA
jgi:hypothetical protein